MNQFIFVLFALLAGALVPLQLTFNAQLGAITKNAFTASLIVFLVGTVALTFVVLLTRPQLPDYKALYGAPITIWLGGLIATLYILAVVVITPKLGVGLTVSLILIAQLTVALLIDHFGWFGSSQHSFNSQRMLGLALMVSGVIMLKKF
jgi:bacterial/archaeal transporter family-2 protein